LATRQNKTLAARNIAACGGDGKTPAAIPLKESEAVPHRRAVHARHAKSRPTIRRSPVIYLNHVDTVEMYVTILSGL
jgi:hypothetical protein